MQINIKPASYREVDGDLILFAKKGEFEVIAHGCNCFCKMKRGLAYQMDKEFDCNSPQVYMKEHPRTEGDVTKLGTIEGNYAAPIISCKSNGGFLKVVNMYTQYHYSDKGKPFDYEAFTSCLRHLNTDYAGKTIGLPRIGTGLAGAEWEIVREIIKEELKDCYVTIVTFKDEDDEDDLYYRHGYFI